EYLRLADLTAYASVSKNTLKKWVECGMPVYRVGRCVMFKRSEFDQWMQQFRKGTESAEDLDSVWAQVMEEV
ncbi:MAG: helix-turn-helix domain-containing protein, partial [Desulfobaccales bacterium]